MVRPPSPIADPAALKAEDWLAPARLAVRVRAARPGRRGSGTRTRSGPRRSWIRTNCSAAAATCSATRSRAARRRRGPAAPHGRRVSGHRPGAGRGRRRPHHAARRDGRRAVRRSERRRTPASCFSSATPSRASTASGGPTRRCSGRVRESLAGGGPAAAHRELPQPAGDLAVRQRRSSPRGPAGLRTARPAPARRAAGTESATRPCVEFLFPPVPPGEDGAAAKADDGAGRRGRSWIAAAHPSSWSTPASRACGTFRPPNGGGEERPATPGDVCLLFRSLSNGAVVRGGAPAGRGAGLLPRGRGKAFFTQQEVHDLIHLLLWLDDPDDTLSLAGVLRSPLFGALRRRPLRRSPRPAAGTTPTSPRLAAGRSPKICPRAAGRAGRPIGSAHARTVLRELDRRPGPAPPPRTYWTLRGRSRTGYDAAVLAEPLGDRKLANLRKLQAMARQQTAGERGLRGFVARLRQSVDDEAAEETAAHPGRAADVVRLMTVHKGERVGVPRGRRLRLRQAGTGRHRRPGCPPPPGPPHAGLPKQIELPGIKTDWYAEYLKAA